MRRTHIHVKLLGSWAEQFSLLFRGYLCSNGNADERYATRKYQLRVGWRTSPSDA